MKHKLLLKTLLFILIPFIGFSQQDNSLSITLKEAQEYAINKNLTLENVRLDIDKARKRVWETTSIGFPQATGKLDYQHVPGTIPTFEFPDENGEPMEMPLAIKNSTTYSVTVSQLIFSGEYIVGLQAAKAYLQISTLNYEKQEIDLKANVLNNYIS
ncbi:TolC family protein [Bacteroidota bacterium]